MKLTKTYALALLFSFPSVSFGHVLKSRIIHTIDGHAIGIDGETVGLIKQYQQQMKAILRGKLQADKTYLGQYSYDGSNYSVIELAQLEQKVGTNSSFFELLEEMFLDFEKISAPFRATVKSVVVKVAMEGFIKESCELRDRKEGDCLLLEWAKPGLQEERKLFNTHVHSIKDFETFLTDLYNFLNDLVESCPKAQAQFLDRLEKYKIARSLLSKAGVNAGKEGAALKKINPHLSTIKRAAITVEKIKEILRS